jgi:hypothetical protein
MQCVRVLLHENSKHGLRHVFIEEAAEFAPQRVGPDQGQVYAEIEKLARMGGNSRLGYTLINQRAEEVNKAVLELCDNLFLHRQKGRNSLTALSKWLDVGNVKDGKEIIGSLSTLPTGECWAWLAGTERPILIKVPQKNSLHPDRRQMRGDGEVKAKAAVDVGSFVSTMRASLGKIEEEAKANDPATLKKRIAELEKEAGSRKYKPVSEEAIRGLEDKAFEKGYKAATAAIAGIVNGVVKAGNEFMVQLQRLTAAIDRSDPEPASRPAATPPQREPPMMAAARKSSGLHVSSELNTKLSAGARKILGVLSQFPEGCEKGKLTLLTGYRYSGGFRNMLSELRTNGCIDGPNEGVMRITPEGETYGPFPTLPQGQALIDYWLNHPSFGKAAKAILAELAGGDELTAEQLSKATGYEYSGGFRNALSELRTAGVLVGANTGRMRISPEIVP